LGNGQVLISYNKRIKSNTCLLDGQVLLFKRLRLSLNDHPHQAEGRWEEAEKALLQAARDVSIPYIDKAGKVMKAQALHQNLEEPSIEPRVQIQIVEPEKYNLVLRVTVPTRKRARLEQDITRRYLQIIEKEQDGRGE
jgi:hypothetical protein